MWYFKLIVNYFPKYFPGNNFFIIFSLYIHIILNRNICIHLFRLIEINVYLFKVILFKQNNLTMLYWCDIIIMGEKNVRKRDIFI